ncbi:PIN domain-containing protein [Duganella sp. FT80W]|uniref:PIN domain-containing protein n=1 Tax=Duganella guangzhouensis TaxID=2666084 RepID=A0A6I2L227_9BURK|nr:type II toxin-antitoxin system VapC family toxin [Duganella guangzhouensis]MRW90349.1 PIN domain-containing protein [Duganella guangzhouensis]
MRYLDTSVLVAYLTHEANSLAAEAFMLSAGAPLAISTWTEVEFFSALGRKLRSGQLTKFVANGIVDKYRNSICANLRLIAVTDADHVYAKTLLDGWKSGLCAGDSLHLAISSAYGATTYTFDRGMAIAGAILGISVILL